jgi:ribonuclease P protein component
MPGRPIGRLVHTADFERVLATPTRSRSAHFAVHHVDSRPSLPVWRRSRPAGDELSTGAAPVVRSPVDESPGDEHWLGSVIPKRHARRAVTRNLLKRQIRSAMERHAGALPPGLWLVRLRSPFAPANFPAAASAALCAAAREELEQLFGRAGP